VEVTDTEVYQKPSKLYVKSKWWPDSVPPKISQRLNDFFEGLSDVFKAKPGRPNLLPHQRQLLKDLRNDKNLIIANTDKGLGPCAIELHRYIDFGLNHLQDASSYRIISTDEAKRKTRALKAAIEEWVCAFEAQPPYRAGTITDMEANYIRTLKDKSWESDPYNYFYLLFKVHKSPLSTRAICSACGGLAHGLGQYVDEKLQPMAKSQSSYFRDTFELKEKLNGL